MKGPLSQALTDYEGADIDLQIIAVLAARALLAAVEGRRDAGNAYHQAVKTQRLSAMR